MKCILLLACALVVSQAAILCPQNFCATKNCVTLTAENCDGRIKANGDACGCCDVCMTQLKEGENCLATMLVGLPPTVECDRQLMCDPVSQKCAKKSCAVRRAELTARLEESRQNGAPLLGLTLPKCDKDDTYSRVQCSGSVCYCVGKDGTQIENFTSKRWEADDMDCKCARDKYEYSLLKIIGKIHRCETNGNYKKLQCTGSVCHCVDSDGKMLTGAQAKSFHISEANKVENKC